MWGGSDIDTRISRSQRLVNHISRMTNVKHFAISNDIAIRLSNLGFQYDRINIDLTDSNIFFPSTIEQECETIYIFNGFSRGKEWIYGRKYYEEICKKFPEYKYIFSNTLNVEYNEMPNVYKQCFIALRLTKHDGNANTSRELNLMKIPIIHNGEYSNCLSWSGVKDIECHIRNRNIELYLETKIKPYNNILFIWNMKYTNEKIFLQIVNKIHTMYMQNIDCIMKFNTHVKCVKYRNTKCKKMKLKTNYINTINTSKIKIIINELDNYKYDDNVDYIHDGHNIENIDINANIYVTNNDDKIKLSNLETKIRVLYFNYIANYKKSNI